ncbi:MAG: RnfABCDGE type electron transport complex subunit D [Spiroplasma sp.]|nr:RnfABCDGE type electron transport complex subunit D [Mycoplasmatales bacterium]
MNFISKTSPYIRNNDSSVTTMMKNVVKALIPVTLCAIYFYRLEFILTLLVSFLSIVGVEYLVYRLLKQESTLYNRTAVITSLIYALILGAGTPLWIVFVGGAFATIFGKLVFGGMGNNIFNPAAIGRVFVLISFGAVLPNAADAGVFNAVIDGATSATPLGALAGDGDITSTFATLKNNYSISDLLVGRTPGAYGESFSLAIILGGIYLIYTKAADYRIIASALFMFILASILFALTKDLTIDFVVYQLLLGGLLFGIVFMATDPVTAPVTPPGRIVYGLMIGGLTFTIRMIGAYPEGMIFAILLMNMFAPLLDFSQWSSQSINKNWKITITITIIIFSLIAIVA